MVDIPLTRRQKLIEELFPDDERIKSILNFGGCQDLDTRLHLLFAEYIHRTKQ